MSSRIQRKVVGKERKECYLILKEGGKDNMKISAKKYNMSGMKPDQSSPLYEILKSSSFLADFIFP